MTSRMHKPSKLTTALIVTPFLLAAGSTAVLAQSDSEERALAPFSTLSVRDGIDVYLTQSTAPKLRLEVEGYELEDIVSDVVGGELRLSRRGRWGNSFFEDRRARVYLDFVELTSITASGGADLESRNELRLEELRINASGGSDVELRVQAVSLTFTVSGGSDVELRGDTQTLAIDATGGSDVDAESLEADEVWLNLTGGSDAVVRASASIDIDATGGSDIVVYGNPPTKNIDNDRSSDIVWR